MSVIVRAKKTAGLVALISVATVLAGCAVGTTPAPEDSSAPSEDAVAYTPDATAEGAAVLEGIDGCAQIGGHFGSLVEGLELSLESLDDSSVFCDWGAADAERVLSVEVWPSAGPVPSTEAVTASGGEALEDPDVSAAGGVVYAIAPSENALALTVVLPTHSASVTLLNTVIDNEQREQLSIGLRALLGLPAG